MPAQHPVSQYHYEKRQVEPQGFLHPQVPADRRLRLPVLQDEHASYSAKRAAAANAAGKSGVKSDAVKAAMERRAAAQQAAADKAARKGRR